MVGIFKNIIFLKPEREKTSEIEETDPEAFISMGSVTGVYGKGFDQIKL